MSGDEPATDVLSQWLVRGREAWLMLRWYGNQVVQQFLDHDCISKAGALTYTTLFAVVPLMTVGYTMFSILPAYDGLQERIEEFVFNNFVPESSALVQEKLIEFSERARGLTAAGLIFLFFTSFLLLVTIEKTFNQIWQAAEPRRGLQRLLVYWGVLSLGPALIICGILITVYFASLPLVSDLDVFGSGSPLLRNLPMLLTWVGFTILYSAMPNCRVRVSHAMLGGFVTMLSFEGAMELFNWTVGKSAITSIYGTFAAVPFFLFWMYLVWVLILCGAILVRTMSLPARVAVEHPEPMLVKCSRVLEVVLAGHQVGQGVSDDEVNNQVRLTPDEHERVFGALVELKLLTRDEEDQWMLARSLKTLTLWDLYQTLPEGLDAARLEKVSGMDHVVEPLKALVQFGSNQMTMSLDTVFGGLR